MYTVTKKRFSVRRVTPFAFPQPWLLHQHNIHWGDGERTGDHPAAEELHLWVKLNIQ